MTFATFTAYYAQNKSNVPASFATEIRREAVARVMDRLQAGRGECVLTFDDLITRMETKIAV